VPAYVSLAIAIAFELVATSLLKASEGFSRLWPTVGSMLGYLGAFYFLSLSLRTIPVGIAYALWSGVGIVLISVIGWFAFKQRLDLPALVGMGLIVAGVIVINAFSDQAGH
jgi:small multidrug resistance pump